MNDVVRTTELKVKVEELQERHCLLVMEIGGEAIFVEAKPTQVEAIERAEALADEHRGKTYVVMSPIMSFTYEKSGAKVCEK